MEAAFDAELVHYLTQQRWFSGEGREAKVTRIQRLPWSSPPGADPLVRFEIVRVEDADGGFDYTVPVAYYREPQPDLGHALIGTHEDAEHGELVGYDALHDKAGIHHLVAAFTSDGQPGQIRHRTLGSVELHEDTPSVLMTGEQSNSSVVVGDDLLLKVFRKVEVGRNPDIEIHEVLTRSSAGTVAALRGWIEVEPEPGSSYDVAMLQEYLRTATDGWDYARNSVRNLLNEGDLYADEVGGDFAGESERLGEVTAQMHLALADAMPTDEWGAKELAALVDRLRRRLDESVAQVADLADVAPAIRSIYDQLAETTEPITVQRVHGDLHLGQALRTATGWRLIDFEGEPAKPLEERAALDSPLRDVAGVLRSLDYAAHSVSLATAPEQQMAVRATEWATRNQRAFCAGYTDIAGELPPNGDLLLRAYELDKAVYEVVYETLYRPTWLTIPMTAVTRLVTQEEDT